MKDEASVNNMRENYFSISSMLRENYKIEWSCYLRWGREVLCEVSRTSYKTWCTNVWHCHQISMGRLYISTVSITRSQESSWSLWVSLVLDTRNHPCRERCLLSLTVTPTLRLTMGPGTGPAPSTRILTLDTGPADLPGPVPGHFLVWVRRFLREIAGICPVQRSPESCAGPPGNEN